MLRVLDIFFALLGLIVGAPVLALLFILGMFDTGSPLFFQQRMGRNQRAFTLVKFRTMKVGTQSVATHLAPAASITRLGSFLRKTKLDELPQLWNVLKGDMSLVGPRPNLFNQYELIEQRQLRDVYQGRPGITGLAQVRGIDMSQPEKLAITDANMLANMNVFNYFKYILQTLF